MTSKDKELQAKWYARLQEAGFEDIELPDGKLKKWSSKFINENKSAFVSGMRQQYYILAGQFFHSHKFNDKIEKLIWFYHSEGLSLIKIREKLKYKGLHDKKSKTSVYNIVSRLRKIMMDEYRKEQSDE